MSATAHPTIAMRPMLPADVPLMAEIFRASIEELAAEDYSEAQREAWAAAADDAAAFGAITLLTAAGVNFVQALRGTPSSVALYTFASNAPAEGAGDANYPLTPVTTAAQATPLPADSEGTFRVARVKMISAKCPDQP